MQAHDPSSSYQRFYAEVFLPEHRNLATIICHVVGAYLAIAIAAWAVVQGLYWAIPLYLPVHVVPGLIAHRLFERNLEVGDLRIDRKDYPRIWFLRANHQMAFDFLRRGAYWR
jgi:hypothetical protein